MKWNVANIFTLREAPVDAELPSHKLLVRAGLIKKLAPGIFTYQNLALRSIRKIENIIRKELNKINCVEVLMPMVQPKELWEETGRWKATAELGLLQFKNRNDQDFCLGPTHEEVVTDLVRSQVRSYRDLPKRIYQIQTKYRDEMRPRYGLMRGREFIMKDLYSFDTNQENAMLAYWDSYHAYEKIFSKMGLNFRPVEADTGAIGGNLSHEFQVLAENGEDKLVVCEQCGFASNVEIAYSKIEKIDLGNKVGRLEKFETPNLKTIKDLAVFLKTPESHLVKTMFYKDKNGQPIAILIRGDLEINPLKLKKALHLKEDPQMLTEEEVRTTTGASPGSCGPVGLNIKIYKDKSVPSGEIIVGANQDEFHYRGALENRDYKVQNEFDLVKASEGQICGKCEKGLFKSYKGIEVGHVFYLGTKYSHSMKATYLNEKSQAQDIVMGCYGIGVTRTMQAAIEQNHDEDGIIWPIEIAPLHIHICVLDQSEMILKYSNDLYNQLTNAGIEVLLDDRDERPGIKFKDADLIGLPFRLTIGSKGFEKGVIEFRDRKTKTQIEISIKDAFQKINELVLTKVNLND